MRPVLTTVSCGAAFVMALVGGAFHLGACPFCSSTTQTLSEEIESMQAVVLATLAEAPPLPDDEATSSDAPLPKAKFRVSKVLKGQEVVQPDDVIEVLYFGEADTDRTYLIMGADGAETMWSTPLGLSPRAHRYVERLGTLPADASRLEFFQEHLEDEDEMLARDAYDEFAKTPYEGVIALKDKMHHDRLIAWIKDPDIPASRRRLYFTMLGVCGTPADAPLLESIMNSDDRRQKAGLDALLACYLILTLEDGLQAVEDRYLQNKDAEYADTYAAIMAIRFHGNDTDVIPKSRLIKALRHLLERPELADLVIPDLARWKDWEVLPRMVALFKEADEKSSWVRVPVINYLRSCPLPEAKQAIEELSKIDPEAVKRAQTYFPFDAEGDGGKASESAQDQSPAASSIQDQSSRLMPPPIPNGLRPPGQGATRSLSGDAPQEERHASTGRVETLAVSSEDTSAAAANAPSMTPATAATVTTWQPNTLLLWGVPIGSGFVLLCLYRLILGLPLVKMY